VQNFIAHLVEVCREVRRVMRPDAVFFLNMGDSYGGSGKGPTGKNGLGDQGKRQGFHDQLSAGKPKSLALVPERLAIALSDDGWIVRSRIAWCKAAPMPESVRDRPTTAWEHIWMLTKGPRYFWDQDATREPHTSEWIGREPTENLGFNADRVDGGGRATSGNPAGRNLWNYWLLPPDPYSGAHFATYPRELVRRCVSAATSEYGACAACGAPWKRVVERNGYDPDAMTLTPKGAERERLGFHGKGSGLHETGWQNQSPPQMTTTGWTASCKCGPTAGVRPCVVLDPFSGSGTSCFVAASLGRIGVGVELSAQYTEQARYGRLAQDFLPI
jgi:DNA modification methylase